MHAQVNVVVMRGQNDDELCEFVELTRHAHINVRFIEWMPFDGNVWNNNTMVAYQEMQAAVRRQFPELQRCQVRPRPRMSVYCLMLYGHAADLGFVQASQAEGRLLHDAGICRLPACLLHRSVSAWTEVSKSQQRMW